MVPVPPLPLAAAPSSRTASALNNRTIGQAVDLLAALQTSRQSKRLRYSASPRDDDDDHDDSPSPVLDAFVAAQGRCHRAPYQFFASRIQHALARPSSLRQPELELFKEKTPTFAKRVTGFIFAIHPCLMGKFVDRVLSIWTMEHLNEKHKRFKYFPKALYAVDVTFQQTNAPSGSFSETMRYFSKKHGLYGVKVEASVLPNGLCVNVTSAVPGSHSDISICQSNEAFHTAAMKERSDEVDMVDHGIMVHYVMSIQTPGHCLVTRGTKASIDNCVPLRRRNDQLGATCKWRGASAEVQVPRAMAALHATSQQRFNLVGQTDATCDSHFRFSKAEIELLMALLEIPDPMITPQRCNASAVEALCILLNRLAWPHRLGTMVLLFGRSREALSTASTHHRWNVLQPYTTAAPLSIAASVSLMALSVAFAVPVKVSKRQHTMATSPEPGSRHDAYLLEQSEILTVLSDVLVTDTKRYVIYGDPAYGANDVIVCGYKGARLDQYQSAFNSRMSTIMQMVKNCGGKTSVCSRLLLLF
ncbi:hypothetical protein H257_15234 [Aphanomyces astaci]|uniref:DDE Tnp4 domain-containing protein n=1 Tax=Aphanomyces astaci TaxID=112090 RepID=W4FPK0_APHAT|nr:hypothetical protein H257_15234 [Aphanomyces astaci]ETV68881.1 hypothetical protein H257_15234 [Aphanomyces astaci]|eukprot:XP_009841558.1 hypothetical protein H257_15234 [Aphanomyces astaci]